MFAIFAPQKSSDLLLAANHCEQSCLLHQQVVGGGARDLAQVPGLDLSNFFLLNCISDIEKGRLLFSSLLEAEGGISLVHLGECKVLGGDRSKGKVLGVRGSPKISRLQNPLDPNKISLGKEILIHKIRSGGV